MGQYLLRIDPGLRSGDEYEFDCEDRNEALFEAEMWIQAGWSEDDWDLGSHPIPIQASLKDLNTGERATWHTSVYKGPGGTLYLCEDCNWVVGDSVLDRDSDGDLKLICPRPLDTPGMYCGSMDLHPLDRHDGPTLWLLDRDDQ